LRQRSTLTAEARCEVLPTGLVAVGDFTELSGRLAVERLLADGTEFDALFAHNDVSAAGVLRALRAGGRKVPDDVAVVGFDNIPMAEHTDPPLTTVRRPTRRMGETAAGMLLAHLGGRPAPDEPVVLPTALVVRQSAP
jgi:LacI family transcriptional regulator